MSAWPTVAVDFDGVLARGSKWEGPEIISGGPVPGAREWLQRMLDNGFRIVVMSSRALDHRGRVAIEHFVERHFGMALEVTSRKVSAHVYLTIEPCSSMASSRL